MTNSISTQKKEGTASIRFLLHFQTPKKLFRKMKDRYVYYTLALISVLWFLVAMEILRGLVARTSFPEYPVSWRKVPRSPKFTEKKHSLIRALERTDTELINTTLTGPLLPRYNLSAPGMCKVCVHIFA